MADCRPAGRYNLQIPEIGGGTYGKVFVCSRSDLTAKEAKKKQKKLVVKEINLKKANRKTIESSQQEANLLERLKHPNIVPYVESFQITDFLYIVMGYCEGGDLYQRVKEQRKRNTNPVEFFDEHQTMLWFIQIAMAMNYLHTENILHRDLKTQNIFLTKAGIIKVGDLGIAKVLENAGDAATTVVGTPYYMSPELFSNRPYSFKSDVWAMGVVLYELCTLRHAFTANDINSLSAKICRGRMPPMPVHYSRDLCELLKSMLIQNADRRPKVRDVLRNQFVKGHIMRYLESREGGGGGGDAPAPVKTRGGEAKMGSGAKKPVSDGDLVG